MSSESTLILTGLTLAAVATIPLLQRSTGRTSQHDPYRDHLSTWAEGVRSDLRDAETKLTWITQETLQAWTKGRPRDAVPHALRTALLNTDNDPTRTDVALHERDLDGLRRAANETVLRRTIAHHDGFFAKVLPHPLGPVESAVVASTENRLLVVGPAGSGKTSLIVARAAWAVHHQQVPPSEILVIAFNRPAATAMQKELDARLQRHGVRNGAVRAITFDDLALQLTERSQEGRRPPVASWSEGPAALETITEIVATLRDEDLTFRRNWDTYRLLFARPTTADPDVAFDADPAAEFTTLSGKVARSRGARMLADWLLLNGVEHVHEPEYTFRTRTMDGSQYRPDVLYPGADIWHEHLVPQADETPLFSGRRQADPIAWRRGVHERRRTTLFETTEAEIVGGRGLRKLRDLLLAQGVDVAWNPEELGDHSAVRRDDLVRLVRLMLTHVQSTSQNPESMDLAWRRNGRLHSSRLFLNLFWPIHAAWQTRLRTEGAVDAAEVIAHAVTAAESGLDTEWSTVLVDDAQDLTVPQARLTRALVSRSGRHLMVVGDDWQSTHRFAGADMSILTEFSRWFARHEALSLPGTHRSTRTISDTASEFVQRNPRQVRRRVRATDSVGDPVAVVRVRSEDEIGRAVGAYLTDLSARVSNASVLVLGRYEFERNLLPSTTPGNLEVSFSTVHDAKGREADHVLLPRMVSGAYGFPSEIPADPVLDMMVVAPDTFRNAEERRLFHVALTRARSSVTAITVAGHESPFVTELAGDAKATNSELSTAEPLVACPACRQGSLTRHSGEAGPFLACSTAPRCRHTQKAPTEALEVAEA